MTEPNMREVAFVGGTLIDGTGAAPRLNALVTFSDGVISRVGARAELDTSGESRVVDVTGKYVIPGLLDANVHLLFHTDPDVLLRYEPGGYDDLVLEAAQITLRAGITTVFDTWGPLESLQRVRDRIKAGEAPGSRILFGGNMIGNGGPWSADFAASYGESLNPAVVDAINNHWEQGVGRDLTW